MVTEGLESRTSDWFIHQVFPNLSWPFLYRIELISLYLSTAVVFYFTRSLYPKESPLLPCRISLGAAVFFSTATIVLPVYLFTRLVDVFYIFLYAYMAWGLFITVMAIKNRRPRAGIILIGLFLLIVTGIYDMLHDTYLDPTPSILNLGVFAFILSQCWALAVNFSEAFTSVELLSSELKDKNDDLARLNELKDEFLANTSHELRTPLNGMVGIAEALINNPEGPPDPKIASNLEIIIACGKRLGNLINDILDFSRLKHRDVKLNPKPTDVRAVTDVILSVFRILIGNKPVTLTNRISDNIPSVIADEDRLQQILFNLVGNAVKFTEKGSVQVFATDNVGYVHVSVCDTGIGIAEDRIDAIFIPFEQDDSRLEKKSDGTGLGLPITQKLVALHGGTINVMSSPGMGSTFTFSLPVSAVPAAKEQVKTREPMERPVNTNLVETPPHSSGTPSSRVYVVSTPQEPVLVVDDDPVNLQVVENHLAMASIPCTTVSNGLAALEIIEQGLQPSMLLLDIMMPQVDGYEICRRLRETHSSAELPIVMLTARNRMEDLVLGLNAGANDYLVKPFSRDELIARVNTQLKIRKSYDTMRENIRLKREIDQRQMTEQELLITQRKLSRMLDCLDDAVIGINESLEISFCNERFQILTGHTFRDKLGKPVETLFDASGETVLSVIRSSFMPEPDEKRTKSLTGIKLVRADESLMNSELHMTCLDMEHERLLMVMIRDTESKTDKSGFTKPEAIPIALIEELNTNRQRIKELECALNTLSPVILENNPYVFNELKSIEKALENMERSLVPDTQSQDKRRLAVNLMKLTVDYWQSATGSDKVALAQESNLWKVYMDNNG
jgi:two-component system sensor histidine kinase ChiS